MRTVLGEIRKVLVNAVFFFMGAGAIVFLYLLSVLGGPVGVAVTECILCACTPYFIRIFLACRNTDSPFDMFFLAVIIGVFVVPTWIWDIVPLL